MEEGKRKGTDEREEEKQSKKSRSEVSSSSTSAPEWPLPVEFFCAISSRVMAGTPVFAQMPKRTAGMSGALFDEVCFEACKYHNHLPFFLGLHEYTPEDKRRKILSKTEVFKYYALGTTISDWFVSVGRRKPDPISEQEARSVVQDLNSGKILSPEECCDDSNLARFEDSKVGRFFRSLTGSQPPSGASALAAAASATPLRKEILVFLLSYNVRYQEGALQKLIRYAQGSQAVALCSPDILAGVVPLLLSHSYIIHNLASKAIMTLSEAEPNRIKIARCKAIAPLIFLLMFGADEGSTNAAAALCNLCTDEENWKHVGMLGQGPVMYLYQIFTQDARNIIQREAAGSVLSNLKGPCQEALGMIAKVGKVVAMADDSPSNKAIELRKYSMKLLPYLATTPKGRNSMMTGGAVGQMVRLAKGEGAMSKNCVSVLHSLWLPVPRERFVKQLFAADGVAVLELMKDEWGEDGKEMAKKMVTDMSKEKKGQR